MKIFDMTTYLILVDDLASDIALSIKLGLAGLILLLVAWRLITGSLVGSVTPALDVFILGLISIVILQYYSDIFAWIVNACESFYGDLRANTFLMEYFVREPDSKTPSGIQDWLTELITKTATAPIAVFAYGFAWICSGLMSILSGVFLSLLFVIGPIYVAIAPVTQGRSVINLLKNIVEICSWKMFCGFTLMIISGIRHVLPSTFLSVLLLDFLVAFSALISPIVVHFLFSSGVASMGTAFSALGARMAIPAMSNQIGKGASHLKTAAQVMSQQSPVPKPGSREHINRTYGLYTSRGQQ